MLTHGMRTDVRIARSTPGMCINFLTILHTTVKRTHLLRTLHIPSSRKSGLRRRFPNVGPDRYHRREVDAADCTWRGLRSLAGDIYTYNGWHVTIAINIYRRKKNTNGQSDTQRCSHPYMTATIPTRAGPVQAAQVSAALEALDGGVREPIAVLYFCGRRGGRRVCVYCVCMRVCVSE